MTPREFFEALARNWDWGIAALAVGAVGALCGITAVALLVAKRPAALAWALLALFASLASAGTGLFARQVQLTRAAGLFAAQSPVHQARMRRLAFEEAGRGPQFGFAGSLLPLMLGAAAAVLASRGRTQALVVATSLALAAAAACATTLWLARAAPPQDAFDFGDHDEAAWDLALALETVATQRAAGCEMLDVALKRFWLASDLLEWPRHFQREPPPSLAGWRAAADTCVRAALDPASGLHWKRRLLLASPLLQDEALRTQIETSGEVLALPAYLDKEAIRSVVMAHHSELRVCYELALPAQPTLSGRLVVQFTIGADGKVSEANSEGGFPSSTVTQCVLARARALVFPLPQDGLPVEVNYPFVFTPAGAQR